MERASEEYKSEEAVDRFVGKAWIKKRKRDKYYRAAKRENYRSRAAFKLIQIQERFNIIAPASKVLDLGASPGGWSQIAKELVGDNGVVYAADIVGMTSIDGITFLRGDLREEEFLEEIVSTCGTVDVVLSDMAPKLSGAKSYDQARAMDLAGIAFKVAQTCLKAGGNFVTKAFRGEDFDRFLSGVAASFWMVRAYSPPATTKGSAEVYVVARGFRPG